MLYEGIRYQYVAWKIIKSAACYSIKLSVLETIECGIIAMPPNLCSEVATATTSASVASTTYMSCMRRTLFLRTPNNKIHHINLNCNNFAYCCCRPLFSGAGWLAGWCLHKIRSNLRNILQPFPIYVLYSLFSICRLRRTRYRIKHPPLLSSSYSVCVCLWSTVCLICIRRITIVMSYSFNTLLKSVHSI